MNLCWTSAVHLLGSAAQGTGDARRTGRMRQIHSADARMGERASDEECVQHVRQIEVGNELSPTGQQAMILATRHRAADESASVGIVHARRIMPVIAGRRSAGEFTRPAPAWLRCGKPAIHDHRR
jgi:hypothetical protein